MPIAAKASGDGESQVGGNACSGLTALFHLYAGYGQTAYAAVQQICLEVGTRETVAGVLVKQSFTPPWRQEVHKAIIVAIRGKSFVAVRMKKVIYWQLSCAVGVDKGADIGLELEVVTPLPSVGCFE